VLLHFSVLPGVGESDDGCTVVIALVEGDDDGVREGICVGLVDGDNETCCCSGDMDGVALGMLVGDNDGIAVGATVGAGVGDLDGTGDGLELKGVAVGADVDTDGIDVGVTVGADVGDSDGTGVGLELTGEVVGTGVGAVDCGAADGVWLGL